jgi:hypothetical protein
MNRPNKPKTHLFSPIPSNASTAAKARGMMRLRTPHADLISQSRVKPCGGKGWLLADNTDHGLRIERCDACLKFANDQAALEAVEKAAQSQPALLKFVEEVATLKHEREPDDDANLSDRPSEDFIATLNQVIMDARQLLGTADKCAECGEVVPYVIGCPDGTELCQDCFDAGQQ